MLGVTQYPVSKDTCIDWADYGRMHQQEHEPHAPVRWTPRWSQSNEKVRQVVAHHLCLTAGVPTVPTDLESLRKLEFRYVDMMRTASLANKQHAALVQRFGGPLTYYTSLIYRRYRLGMNSVQLAQQYGITPYSVRVQLHRLCRIARQLFAEQAEHAPWHQSARNREVKPLQIRCRMPQRISRAARLHAAGRPWAEILEAFGCKYKNKVKRALRKYGVYTARPAGAPMKKNRKKHV